MVVINGKQEEATGLTVMDYLTKIGFNPLRVVVEINYEIIPKEKSARKWSGQKAARDAADMSKAVMPRITHSPLFAEITGIPAFLSIIISIVPKGLLNFQLSAFNCQLFQFIVPDGSPG